MKRSSNPDFGAARRPGRAMPILCMALCLSACGRQAAAPTPAPAAGPAWNWLDFQRSDRLMLAPAQAMIEPAQVEMLKAPRDGWFMPAPGVGTDRDKDEPLAGGAQIGRMAPGTDALEEEGEALHQKLAEVEAQLRQMRNEEAAESFADQERKANEEIAIYEAALILKDDPAVRRDLLPQAEQASPEEITRIKDRLAAARERLKKSRAAGERQAALQKRATELADAKAAFERGQKAERDSLKAPFAGQLRWVIAFEPVPADPAAKADPKADPKAPARRRAWVRNDTLIGVLRDNAALWAKAEIADASLLSVPADQLFFSFSAAGEPVDASFGGRAPESNSAPRAVPVYQFAIKEATPARVRLAGGVVAGNLMQRLPQAAYIVPKMRLLVHRSDAFADGEWARNCARVFPGCRVLAIGRDAVAIVPGELPAESPAEGKP